MSALKVEIMEVIKRRFDGDARNANEIYGVCAAVIVEVIADMTFSAAKDENHGRRLLSLMGPMIETRWSQLAKSEVTRPPA